MSEFEDQFSIHRDLKSYFVQQLLDLNEKQGTPVSVGAISYMSDVLVRANTTDFLFGRDENQGRFLPCLTDIYHDAQKAESRYEHSQMLQLLGERALSVLSLVPEAFERRRTLTNEDYYRDMGVASYKTLASLKPDAIFGEIAEGFVPLTNIARLALSQESPQGHTTGSPIIIT